MEKSGVNTFSTIKKLINIANFLIILSYDIKVFYLNENIK